MPVRPLRRLVQASPVITALLVAACGESGPSTDAAMRISVATRPAGAAASGAPLLAVASAPGTETFTDGTNTLVLTKAELVVEELEFREDDGDGVCWEGDDDDGPAPAGLRTCARYRGPMLVLDLPLGTGGAERAVAFELPAGTYDKVGIGVGVVDPGEDGEEGRQAQALLARRPDLAGVSVKVTGTWNGQPFTYTGSAEREFGRWFTQPLVVAEGAAANVTLFVDVARWFRDGATLIDPASAAPGQPNAELVERNIVGGFEAFEDDDEDGDDDDSIGGDDRDDDDYSNGDHEEGEGPDDDGNGDDD